MLEEKYSEALLEQDGYNENEVIPLRLLLRIEKRILGWMLMKHPGTFQKEQVNSALKEFFCSVQRLSRKEMKRYNGETPLFVACQARVSRELLDLLLERHPGIFQSADSVNESVP